MRLGALTISTLYGLPHSSDPDWLWALDGLL